MDSMRIRRLTAWLATAGLLLLLVGSAFAFTLTNVDGIWSTIDGGEGATCDRWATGPGDNPASWQNDWWNQTPPNTDENQVRYGSTSQNYSCSSTVFANQSGFGFDGNNNVGTPVSKTPFYLGTFTHHNRPIYVNNTFQYVDLTVGVPILCNDGNPAIPPTFSFTPRFWLDETPNSAPCTYPGNTICPDKVTVTQTGATQTFGCTERS